MNPILSGIIRPLSRGPQRLAIASGLATLLSAAPAAEPNVTVAAQSGGALRSIGRGVSINDRGDIGFMAALEKGHNVFCIDGDTGERRALMNGVFVLKAEGDAPSQTFSEYVQVSNQREVAAQRRMNALVLAGGIFGTMTTAPLTYVERWPYHGNRSNPGRIGLPNSLFAMGDGGAGNGWLFTTFLNPATGGVYPSPFNQDGGFSAVMGAPAMNNSGQMVCSTLRGSSNWFITTKPGGFLGAPSNTGVARPQLADNGFFTLRVSDDPNTAIYWFTYDYGTFDQAVHSGNGFGAKSLPGIDDAGTLIVFCADLSAAGAAQLDITQAGLAPINPGPGLFWSKVVGTGRFFRRLAGVSGNGYVDPGETWVDTNNNGIVNVGEDQGVIGGFNYQSRACVNQIATGFSAVQAGGMAATASSYLAAFAGTTNIGAPAVFTVEFPAASTGLLKSPAVLVKAGDSIPGLAGTPAEFELHDAVSKSGMIACWARTSSGSQAIITGRARPARHLHVLTHGLGNASDLHFGPLSVPFPGLPDFLSGWETLKTQIAYLPATYGSAAKQRELDGRVVSYVANWPSSDGWIQAVTAVCAMRFAPQWTPQLLLCAEENMRRAAMHADNAAERIVNDLGSMGMLTGPDTPQIHLIGHSRGAAVNARVARLLKSRGITPSQYTALDGYAPDWPAPSNILADLDIVTETTNIPNMRRVNVMVDDGFDELGVRLILDAQEALSGHIASWIGRPAPHYAEAAVDDLKQYMFQWKAPPRNGFENYVLTGCGQAPGFTNHMTITKAYTFCDRPSGLRALMDGPLGFDIGQPAAAATPVRAQRGNAGSPAALPAFRNGDFDALGLLAADSAAKPIPAGLDLVVDTFLNAMKRSDFILSSSWELKGITSLVASGSGYAVRMEQTASGTSLTQTIQVPETATAIEFDLTILAGKPEDSLNLMVGADVLGSVPMGAAGSQHLCFSLFGYAGRLSTVGLKLDGAPGTTPAAVIVDNIRATNAHGTGEPALSVVYNHQDGVVDITLTGTPGRTFQVQASADLKEWIEIDAPMNFTGSKVIRESPPSGTTKRYYRVAM